MGADSGRPIYRAPAHEFLRTHAISGRSSSRRVRQIMESMKANGWAGPPVMAVEHEGDKYLLDGHHRTFAARMALIPVQYCLLGVEELRQYFLYDSIDQVIRAHAEAGYNRIRLR